MRRAEKEIILSLDILVPEEEAVEMVVDVRLQERFAGAEAVFGGGAEGFAGLQAGQHFVQQALGVLADGLLGGKATQRPLDEQPEAHDHRPERNGRGDGPDDSGLQRLNPTRPQVPEPPIPEEDVETVAVVEGEARAAQGLARAWSRIRRYVPRRKAP